MTTEEIIRLAIAILVFSNLIRFTELHENTSLFTWKQYWVKKEGIFYSLAIIGIFTIFYLISKIK